MNKRSLKCRDFAPGLAGGVRTESYIETAAGNCTVAVGERATHIVRIKNLTMLRYEVKVSAECESAHLRYGTDKVWTAEVEVTGRKERILRGELHCADSFIDQGVKMTLSYTAIGCKGAETATLQLLLDTRD
jgi:hypothetical protein